MLKSLVNFVKITFFLFGKWRYDTAFYSRLTSPLDLLVGYTVLRCYLGTL